MKNSCDIVAEAVRDFWKENIPCDVVVFFYQKYEHEEHWSFIKEYVMFDGDWEELGMEFVHDFCEGQTCVKNFVIVPFSKVAEHYYNNEIKKEVSE